MKVKELAHGRYSIVAAMDGDKCPAEDFLANGDASTAAARAGLYKMLEIVAIDGLQNIPSAWSHEANKREKIYEFIKGPLRLFFFKGEGDQIAVCVTGVRKNGAKADKASVDKAAECRKAYLAAANNKTLEVVKDGA